MVHVIVLFPDTTIAELVKEVVYSDEFRDFLSAQQGSVVVRVESVTYLITQCSSRCITLLLSADFIHDIDSDKVCVYIEDCIARKEPLVKVLRLVCIQCCCNDGLKPKVLDYYKREILQVAKQNI